MLNLTSLDVFIRGEAARTAHRLGASQFQYWRAPIKPGNMGGMGPLVLHVIRCTTTNIYKLKRGFAASIPERDAWLLWMPREITKCLVYRWLIQWDWQGAWIIRLQRESQAGDPLGCTTTVFQAEVLGILMRFDRVVRGLGGENVLDSQAAISAIVAPKIISWLVLEFLWRWSSSSIVTRSTWCGINTQDWEAMRRWISWPAEGHQWILYG